MQLNRNTKFAYFPVHLASRFKSRLISTFFSLQNWNVEVVSQTVYLTDPAKFKSFLLVSRMSQLSIRGFSQFDFLSDFSNSISLLFILISANVGDSNLQDQSGLLGL